MSALLVCFGGLAAISVAPVGHAAWVASAWAEEVPLDDVAAPAPAAQASKTTAGCRLSGVTTVAKGTKLFDQPSDGKVVGVFTGALTPLTISQPPADFKTGRAQAATRASQPSLRIEGYVSPTSLRVYAKEDLPVVADHLWITSGYRVDVIKVDGDHLEVSLSVAGSVNKKVAARAPCDSFALEPLSSSSAGAPPKARGFMMKRSDIQLFDRPGGAEVLSLKMIEGSGQLYWSTETKVGWVHVMSRGDLRVDAWARQNDLQAVRPGEMKDQFIPTIPKLKGAQLKLEGTSSVVRASEELAVRRRRDEKDAPIGAVEVGAELLMLETVGTWTNVLPKGLGIMPEHPSGFWVPASSDDP